MYRKGFMIVCGNCGAKVDLTQEDIEERKKKSDDLGEAFNNYPVKNGCDYTYVECPSDCGNQIIIPILT